MKKDPKMPYSKKYHLLGMVQILKKTVRNCKHSLTFEKNNDNR
jgi:hypothetical protein